MSGNQAVNNISRMYTERVRRGWTRKEVADAAGISARAVLKFEKGFQYPTKNTYNRLAIVFGWEVWQ